MLLQRRTMQCAECGQALTLHSANVYNYASCIPTDCICHKVPLKVAEHSFRVHCTYTLSSIIVEPPLMVTSRGRRQIPLISGHLVMFVQPQTKVVGKVSVFLAYHIFSSGVTYFFVFYFQWDD